MSFPKKTVGLAWCGVWRDGHLGFISPNFVSSCPNGLSAEQKQVLKKGQCSHYPSDLYRVRITIELVPNKRGEPIVKRNPNRHE